MKYYFLALLFISVLFLKDQTVAVSYFDNTSGVEKYNPLSKGLADMLITDLSNIHSIQIVEREKLQQLINEIDLGKEEFFDPKTAQQIGEGLGAKIILTGAFLSIEPEMRIDARLVEVQTGKIISASKVKGNSTDIFAMIDQLSQLIIKELQVTASTAPLNASINIESVIEYSKSIDLFDKGLNEEAKEILSQTINTNPDFVYAKDYLEKLKERIKQIEDNRKLLVNAKILNMINNLNPNSDTVYSQINNIWMSLFTSPHKMLAFNRELKKLNLNYENKIFGESSPVTFGEMIAYYNIFSYWQLNNHIKVIHLVESFLTEYPASMYYSAAKNYLNLSIQELEGRKNGKKIIKNEIKKYKTTAKIKNIQKYFIYYNNKNGHPKHIATLQDYYEAKNYYIKNVLNLDPEYLKKILFYNSWDGSEYPNQFSRLFTSELIKTALYFSDIDFAEKLLEQYESLLLDSGLKTKALDLEERYYRLEEGLENSQVFESAKKEKIIKDRINQRKINYYVENAEALHSSLIDSIQTSNLDSLYLAIRIKRIDSDFIHLEEKQEEWNKIYKELKKFNFLSLLNDAMLQYEKDTSLQEADNKTHKKYLRTMKRTYNQKTEEYNNFKSIYSDNSMLAYMAVLNKNNKQYADEIAIRYEILKKLNLSYEEEASEYSNILISYIALGYFEKAQEILLVLKTRYKDSRTAKFIGSYEEQIYLD